ncbi:MAG: sarcosine oxidase subunit gamma [Marinosulfonomonas sp.]
MSETVSAASEAVYEGYVTVTRVSETGMVSVRGDFSDAKFKKAIKASTGLPVPERGAILHNKKASLAWMSPDEVLILSDYETARGQVTELGKALAGSHHLVANVSDARAMFTVKGDRAREILAKLSPADVTEVGFGPGQMRRSRMAQVAAAFWITADGTVNVVCFRSVGAYVFDLLKHAARPGAEV